MNVEPLMTPTPAPVQSNRAWLELDLAALRHNYALTRSLLPPESELYAVLKANAYGHGDTQLAATLSSCGCRSFAVACLDEALRLRKAGVKGEILILGYTSPEEAELLIRHRLTQAITDAAYAKQLRGSNRIRCQIKVDTGLHRLGIDAAELEQIAAIYRLPHLKVRGIFSHLGVADSLADEDVAFSEQQINRFFELIFRLRVSGVAVGQTHIQASYGIINYPGLLCGAARAGLLLYGVLSDTSPTLTQPQLQPVLSLRARVSTLRELPPGTEAGYGRDFVAPANGARIAMLGIGYGDGLPRSYNEAEVLLHGQRAPIVGRMCMDQLMVDVSHLNQVQPGDIATLIGQDGDDEIRVEQLAEKCGTISNEILSKLAPRLERIYLN